MKKVLFILFILMTNLCLFSQEMQVENGDNPESEFHAAINPKDTNHLVVAVMAYNPASDTFSVISIYYTFDQGETWQKSGFDGQLAGTFAAGDPVLAFDPNGRLYLASLTLDNIEENIVTVYSFSDDGGANWQSKREMENVDKPWLAIDLSPQSPFFGRKYVPIATEDMDCLVFGDADTLLFASKPFLENYDFTQIASVDVQSDGDVFIGHYFELNNAKGIKVLKSNDGAATFLSEVTVANTTMELFSGVVGVTENANPTAYLAIDRSFGPFHNRIYMVYTDNEVGNSDIFDIFISWSDDDAQTWTAPKVVHPNAPIATQQFYSSVFVNPNGAVVIGYYDHRLNENDTDFYLAISENGGENFVEHKMTSIAFDFSAAQVENGGFGIGDYGQVLATSTTAIAFWADGRTNDGDLNVFFSKKLIKGNMVGSSEIASISDKFSFGKPFPVPALTTVFVPCDFKISTEIAFNFYNEDGKLLKKGQINRLSEGKNQLKFDLPNEQGALFLALKTSNGVLKTFKIR
jgi:hypothetical protein